MLWLFWSLVIEGSITMKANWSEEDGSLGRLLALAILDNDIRLRGAGRVVWNMALVFRSQLVPCQMIPCRNSQEVNRVTNS